MTPDSAAVAAIGRDVVKALEWSKTFEDQSEESWSAAGLGGEYVVRKILKPLSIWFYHAATEKAFLTVDEAKTYAQAHFNSAILSALSPAFIERIGALERENVSVPPLKKYDYCKPHKFLLLASYCGGDTPGCTENDPCINCIRMCNAYDADGKYVGTIKCVDSSDGNPEEQTAFKSWLRQWVHARFGKWITYSTAHGAYRDFLDARTAIQEPTKVEDGERQGDEG